MHTVAARQQVHTNVVRYNSSIHSTSYASGVSVMHDICSSLSSFRYDFGGTGSRVCKQVILVRHFQSAPYPHLLLDLASVARMLNLAYLSSQALMDPYNSYAYFSNF